ncbi:AAA family ATPase [uncultured virus]|nr:AAA family ATPase [uncultured virus]
MFALMGMMMTKLFGSFEKIVDYVIAYLTKPRKEPPSPEESSICVISTTVENASGILSKSTNMYRAVIFYAITSGINVRHIQEQGTCDGYRYCVTTKDTASDIFDYIIDIPDEIVLDAKKDIRIRANTETKKTTEKDNNMILKRSIRVFSSLLTVNQLLETINEWQLLFDTYMRRYVDDGTLHYYSLQVKPVVSTNNDRPQVHIPKLWKKYQFVTSKTFDNIFFTGKPKLLSKLQFFLDNKDIYSYRGVPYNLGLLFYGQPGCGKTSCIKAIANRTRRHVFEISLNRIRTCGEFVDVITNEFIDGKYIPIDRRLMVLEDIDCMDDIVLDRELGERDKTDLNSLLAPLSPTKDKGSPEDKDHKKDKKDKKAKKDKKDKDDEEDKSSNIEKYLKSRYKAEDKLTLSCILNTIDGVLEQHGRIMIISSNYPDKLDKALVRPGRIDIKIDFTKCTHEMITEMLEYFFRTKLESSLVFPDQVHTPAEVINMCIDDTLTLEQVIEQLMTPIQV